MELSDIKEKLETINLLLASTPQDAALLQMQSDLKDLITLATETDATKAASGESSSSSATTASGESAKVSEYSLLAPVEDAKAKRVFTVGDRVDALWDDGKYYAAVIEEIFEEKQNGVDCVVKFFDYNQSGALTLQSLRPYTHADVDKLVEGTRVRALYEGKAFFAGAIDDILPNGKFQVLFDPYRGKRIRHICSAYDIVLDKNRKPVKQKEISAEFTVPDSLVIRATDSEAKAKQKKKIIRKMKFEHSKKVDEQDKNKKQASWQNFQSSLGKKRKAKLGSVGGKKKKKKNI